MPRIKDYALFCRWHSCWLQRQKEKKKAKILPRLKSNLLDMRRVLPNILAEDIIENLQSALESFQELKAQLKG